MLTIIGYSIPHKGPGNGSSAICMTNKSSLSPSVRLHFGVYVFDECYKLIFNEELKTEGENKRFELCELEIPIAMASASLRVS